jgi:hypothetical protein
MGLFQPIGRFVWNRPIAASLAAFVVLFALFGIAIAIINRTAGADVQAAETLAWNVAMMFGLMFWLLVLAVVAYALLRIARWLFGSKGDGRT